MPAPPSIRSTPTGVAAFVGAAGGKGPLEEAHPVASLADYVRVFGRSARATALGRAVESFFANGGERVWVVSVSRRAHRPPVAQLVGTRRGGTGLYALADTEFDVLAIPDGGRLEPRAAAAIVRKAAAVASARRAFYVVDPPQGLGVADVARWARTLPDVADAACVWPHLSLAAAGRAAPSGAVAGVMARIDRASGVWKPPAGTAAALTGVKGPARTATESELATLVAARVNPLRRLPDGRTVLWGSRTLSGDPDWKYVSVRRYVLFLERSIDRGLQWTVFEPNGQALWNSVRRTVEDFLFNQFEAGALRGNEPSDAFFVRCDRTTMTQDDIDNGRLVCLVGVAPVHPAEFVIVRIGGWAGRCRR
ncbi:MAG TPA: phage tail sheath C-terminal domain-containing protein [Gaiellaceae bacterium]